MIDERLVCDNRVDTIVLEQQILALALLASLYVGIVNVMLLFIEIMYTPIHSVLSVESGRVVFFLLHFLYMVNAVYMDALIDALKISSLLFS